MTKKETVNVKIIPSHIASKATCVRNNVISTNAALRQGDAELAAETFALAEKAWKIWAAEYKKQLKAMIA